MTPERVITDGDRESAERSAGCFATTHWSVVLAAGDSVSPGAGEALEKLCRTYWYPLYAFVRRKGHGPEEARDLTQAFFLRLLQKRSIKEVVRERGRFRTFLLTIFQRFLCDQFDRAAAAKRGGGICVIPLDTAEAEAEFDAAVASSQRPELIFDRAWAGAVVQTSLERLRAHYQAEGRASLFGELRHYLSGPADRSAYAASAVRLGLSADAVAMAVTRLRRRYREVVRTEVANTVATPAEIDDELRYLVELLTH